MDKLLLFDIDGTLLKNAKGHKDAFKHAFKEVYCIDTSVNILEPNGMTDQQIIIDVLKLNNLTEEEIKPKIKDCINSMVLYYDKIKNKCESPIVLEGVKDLLNELENQGYLMGLVTGNLEPIARGKLERININQFFKLGGFGSDNISRIELVKLAIKRAEEKYNFIYKDNVFLFGDAPQDMNAGYEAGIKTIGTLTGIFSKESLEKAGANFIVENFNNINNILKLIEN